MNTLYFGNHQVALAEESSDLKFVGACSSTQNTAGQVDRGEGELRQ
jgi:UDP-N-acetylglucosamine transferase subunit ALG13